MRPTQIMGLALVAGLVATSTTGNDAAVVQLDGCSGVCVSPDGLVLTAEHCGSEASIVVEFANGAKYPATLVYSPPKNQTDECQAYQIKNASDLPHAIISKSPPRVGDVVSSVGYPFGNYQRNAGKVIRIGYSVRTFGGQTKKQTDGLVCDWQTDSGNSGGPLFNANGEVVGIGSLSSKDEPESYWIGGDSIATALSNRKHAVRSRRLIMFSRKGCSACELYAAEIKRTGAAVTVVKRESTGFAEWQENYERHTGEKLDFFPTFWVENTAESREEDYQPGLLQRILGWFGNTIRQIIEVFIGQQNSRPLRPQPDPIGEPPQESAVDLPPSPTEELDPANITIVIAAAMQDVGAIKGAGIKLAISKAEGPLSRAINEKIGAKATLVLIPQRTQPERFAAITSAARITANPAAVLVLIKAQSLGLKTLIAGKVESMLVGKIPESIPVELIFERIHGDDFAAINLALATRETQNFERSTPSSSTITEDGIVAKLMPAITAKLGEKLAASDNALVAKLGDKLTPTPPAPEDEGPKPSEQGIMGGLGLLILERLRSMWLRRKAEKAIVDAEKGQPA